jgi:short-subunit dehydrogenase
MSEPASKGVLKVLILGATSAIAMAVERRLAAEGAVFYLVGRDPERVRSVAADLRVRSGAAAYADALDLADTSGHEAMLRRAVAAMGGIDLALVAYGVLGDQARAEASYPAAARILETNFNSVVSLLTWLGNYFEAQGKGVLAVISSVAGDRGRKSNYVYGASKAALNAFLDGMRARLDRKGVHVLTIRPGLVASPMTAHLPRTRLFAEPDAIAAGILKAIQKRKDIVYLPPAWGPIMFIVRNIPEFIFKKTNL